jgi:predicted O-linked N-acetylglucosamine transferase (SPINDLY family)
LRTSIELDGENALFRAELGLALDECGEHEEAVGLFRDVLRRRPEFERMRWLAELSLPAVYADERAVDLARARFREGLARVAQGLDLGNPARAHAAYEAAATVTPFHLHYQPRDNTELQCRYADLVQSVMDCVAPAFVRPVGVRSTTRSSRIRVGFLSRHVATHSVTRFFGRLVTDLDPRRFEVSVWSTGGYQDQTSERIARAVSSFERLPAEPAVIAAKVRKAGLDALVHLDIGMDPVQQVLAALRLAPVQCVLYGHPVTSGSASIDYFLSGDLLEPANASTHYRESLVRLPGIAAQPERSPTGGNGAWVDALRERRPLLLCLQNLLKLVPGFDRLVARVIAETGARVGFFDRATALRERFSQRLERVLRTHGLSLERDLVFIPDRSHADFVAGIARADAILDTPWFSGGATTLDALSVGTPVVTLGGSMLRGRQSAAMLRLAGVPELIATDGEAYVERVRSLCTDSSERDCLRQRLLAGNHAIFDDPAPIRALETFLAGAVEHPATGPGATP